MAKEKKITIRSYDVMYNSTHKISSLYKYFQQIASDDLDAFGISYEALLERGIVFVLAKMKTVFYAPLHKKDEFFLKSCHRRVKGVSFIRDYILTKNGETVAEASSYWVLMDINTRKLCRPSVLNSDISEPLELCSFEIDERFSFPDFVEADNYCYDVAFSDIDENRHMNNTRYPDICLDALGEIPDNAYVSEIFIDYLAESKLGERLEIQYNKSHLDDCHYFSAHNLSSGKKCFNAKIKLSLM